MGEIRRYILFAVAGVIIGLLLFNSCDKNVPSVKTEVNTITDTTYKYITHVDTIQFDTTIITYIEVPIPVYDTIRDLNKYTIKHKDSLIDLSVDLAIDGVLVDKPLFKYTPKFPKYINITDTIFKTINNTTTITNTINKRSIYAGAVFGIDNNKNLTQVSPTISFKDKKSNLFSFGYDVLSNEYRVGYQRELKFK